MPGYNVPAVSPDAPHCAELTINRSRFIVSMARTGNQTEARAFINSVRQRFPDATHNCWAYVVGQPGDAGQAACNDDGEPSGTAGRPMLTVLLHAPVGEVTAVVTRYFGGIKLGTGGLVHAYQNAVLLGLEQLPVVEHMVPVMIKACIRYPHISAVKRLLPAFRTTIQAESFSQEVTLDLVLPVEQRDDLIKAITNATAGSASIISG